MQRLGDLTDLSFIESLYCTSRSHKLCGMEIRTSININNHMFIDILLVSAEHDSRGFNSAVCHHAYLVVNIQNTHN